MNATETHAAPLAPGARADRSPGRPRRRMPEARTPMPGYRKPGRRTTGRVSLLGGMLIGVLLIGVTGAPAARADDRVDKALERAVKFVYSRQDTKDALFKDRWHQAYPMGESALSLLALLKAGADPDDKRIKLGFRAMMALPMKKVYSVSLGILAIEAKYSPTAEQLVQSGKPFATVARRRFKKQASPVDKRWVAEASRFLVKHQARDGLWKYPYGGDADVSNMQFALLALKSARRLGIRVPGNVWMKSTSWLIQNQESSGGKVDSFAIPAAEGPIGKLDKRTGRGESAASRERVDLFARGFGYKVGEGPRGSMTAAGVACLVVCKSELETIKGFDKKLGPKVDKAIRDGSAWLAQRFAADKNPGADQDWLFYYLYTLERAGTLTGCETFGSHAWHALGTNVILGLQKGDGRFERPTGGESDGLLAGTCLAILFLKRSTVPVIERAVTGGKPPAASSTDGGGTTRERLADGRWKVTFRLRLPHAGAACHVAGSFNGWSKDAHRLSDSDGDGIAEVTVMLDAGRHTYKFVVDGSRWIPDPAISAGEPDGHGGRNTVLELN